MRGALHATQVIEQVVQQIHNKSK